MKELNILYTVDDEYLKFAAVSIESVIFNNPTKRITFYLCTDKDEKTENFTKLKEFYENNKNISFIHVDAKKYDTIFQKHNLDKWGSNSYYVYWRLIAPSIIDVENLIYLDSDILCLKEIEFPDLNGKSSGCVIDCVHPHYNDVLKISREEKLYNTGTLFIDVKQWNQKNCTEKMITYLNTRDKFLMADQDIYSLALQDDITDISLKYNYFAGFDYYGIKNSYKILSLYKKSFYRETEVSEAKKDVIFYHCLDGAFKRPWINGNTHPLKEQYLQYMNKAAFGDITYNKRLNGIFIIEKNLEFLPNFIYNKVHNFALWLSFELRKNTL